MCTHVHYVQRMPNLEMVHDIIAQISIILYVEVLQCGAMMYMCLLYQFISESQSLAVYLAICVFATGDTYQIFSNGLFLLCL